ncbi:hypothetical protein BKA67DRAFT_654246 [Truncatella angustata]|uniref:Peptidyl-prolyl cis-trans isomerase n=1 Tax=Truncatella angustata TaxID=152316 RepID=A0A9P8UYW2_9PEZI|nr:uncharacterized protein BKA67DRAFT_654246 [Truncatella angustata]KAH6661106.1 hypothetical protein BKA67DRAFT_654246 [Truncatella angustata]
MAGGKKGKNEGKSQAKGDSAKPAKGGKGKGNQDTKEPVKNKSAQQILVRNILCDKFSRREEALAELRQGESWKAVCDKYAIEKVNSGGLIGWKKKGDVEAEFATVAFSMPSIVEHHDLQSYPYGDCKTSFGYHIIRVDEKK